MKKRHSSLVVGCSTTTSLRCEYEDGGSACLLQKAEHAETHIGRNDLVRMGRAIKYFPGVERWFARINKFVRQEGKGRIKIKHYIVSAGLKEILQGTSIKKHFARIYAPEYHFDHHDKGKEDLGESINDHMYPSLRPIPFANIIYIGDGITDVPSMAVTKSNGGNTIAVYKKNSHKGIDVCKRLRSVGRTHFIAQADYRLGFSLDKRVEILLRSVIASIEYERELFDCRRTHSRPRGGFLRWKGTSHGGPGSSSARDIVVGFE